MLATVGLLSPVLDPAPQALEASVFNSGKKTSAAAISTKGEDDTFSVIPLGSTFGIKLFTDGVIVASLSEVYTANGLSCPAASAGIRPGDYVLEANGQALKNNDSLAKIVGASQGETVLLKLRREDRVFEAILSPVYSQGSFKLGMWVRDSAAGIGTLTFYDPSTGVFAGLGHGICDMDTAKVMTLKSGEPAEITLCGIHKGAEEEPGKLRGYFSGDQAMGSLLQNNETGVYGTLESPPTGKALEVAKKEDVKTGPVQILATIDENGPKLYEARIEKISSLEQATKNLIVTITDPLLLERTGGIVQGMSGCPILQDGKLAGAITHVFTDDPTTGYGIFAQTMCAQAVEAAGQNL